MSGKPRHIVFAWPNPSYLRFFEGVVTALRARGHRVTIARWADGRDAAALARAGTLAALEQVPAADPAWRPFHETLGELADYVRFMAPEFAAHPYLRQRMDKYLPPRFAWLRQRAGCSAISARLTYAATRLLEDATPADAGLMAWLARLAPDVLVISPLVLRGPGGAAQTQLLKAAAQRGVPSVLTVGSWDHLSSKGLIRVRPDRVVVWNETQRTEAVRFHGMPAERVTVTGAYPWDIWFGMKPTVSREQFLATAGLPVDQPFVLYAGSSRGIVSPADERAFVRDWVTQLRQRPALARVGVMIRPHPGNRHWTDAPVDAPGPIAVWPVEPRSLPMTASEQLDYFHSLHYGSAVVGINTSAMIEAAIVGRPVLTVSGRGGAQDETIHFAYLTVENGGGVMRSTTFDEHAVQLEQALTDPGPLQAAAARFVRDFVRPFGDMTAGVPLCVAAIETAAGDAALTSSRHSGHPPVWLAPVRAAARMAARRLSSPTDGRRP